MPTLRDQTFRSVYMSPMDDVVCEFFIPALKASDSYCRATGFFSSYSLVDLSKGLCDIARRNGKVRVITSPRLSPEDVSAIKNGYDMREVAGEAMLRQFEEPEDSDSIQRLALLSELIASGVLEMKVVVMRNLDSYPNSIFHAKFGVMEDSEGNKVSFAGSMNETGNGLGASWENIDVFSSQGDNHTVAYEEAFDNFWEGRNEHVCIIDMPDVIKDLLGGYRKGEPDYDLDRKLLEKYDRPESVYFKSPGWLKLRPYQVDAIKEWEKHGYHGIFNMATGTGKTKTAMCALEYLYNSKPNDMIITIIVAPLKHLVDQWADEVREYDVRPIIGHSESTTRDWKRRFEMDVNLSKRKDSKRCCLITTVASFSSDEIQGIVSRIDNLALVVDEAHHMGSAKRLTKLPNNAKYRLALSATIDRHRDKSGTEHLRGYFGEECITLSIDEAIGKDYLAKYYYHPLPCVYDETDYVRFVDANRDLNAVLSNPSASKKERQKAKNQYIEQSFTINAGMESKYGMLVDVMSGRTNESHILVYCGKVKVDSEGEFDHNSQALFVSALDKVVRLIGKNGLGFEVSRITYQESSAERKIILDDFEDGRTQVVVAISCLDEGMDMPSIKTAVIMTSSDNPREYIQRRGRVLRKHPGKDYAVIYDMIVIPKALDCVERSSEYSGLEIKMLAKEIRRMREFDRNCLNPEETENLLSSIEAAYGISIQRILEDYGEDYDERD